MGGHRCDTNRPCLLLLLQSSQTRAPHRGMSTTDNMIKRPQGTNTQAVQATVQLESSLRRHTYDVAIVRLLFHVLSD
jgi:hypothetical protein